MFLTVLGNNGPYPDKGGATSGYLLEINNQKLLLDCGSGVFANLIKLISPSELSAILITHLHFDHVSDLGVLAYYLNVAGKKIKLYLPDKSEFIEQIVKLNAFEVEFYSQGQINLNEISVSATQVKHPVKSFALTFKTDKTFTYTGDTNFCPQVENLFKMSDTILCDACFLQNSWAENKPHMSVKGICELGQKYSVKTILTHLNPQTDKQKYIDEAFGDYFIAQIGDKITI